MTPNDMIRKTALQVLAKHKSGIRQSDLIKKVESILKSNIMLADHTVRNAIWDLEVKYPEAVYKKKISHRNVLLLPKDELVEKYADAEIDGYYEGQQLELDDIPMAFKDAAIRMRSAVFAAKLLEVYRYIELSEIEDFADDLFEEQLKNLTPKEVEIVIKTKSALEDIRNARNHVAHFGFGSLAGEDEE